MDALVITREENKYYILLIQRAKEPFQGKWALPGGFVDMDETLERACLRELREETTLNLQKINQFRVFDAINRDPRQRTVSTVFYSIIEGLPVVTGQDDAKDAKWFDIKKLPELAFDHPEIINTFIKERLRSIK